MADIKIGNSDTEYFNSISSILHTIKKNPIGGVIIDFLLKHKKTIWIYPFDKGDAAVKGEDNASTRELSGRDAAPKGVSQRGPNYWYWGRSDHPGTREDERFDMVPREVGTGAGSDAVTKFSPERIQGNKPWDRRPDTDLLHELVHGLRKMQGLSNPVPTKEWDWKNEEEFFAVVVQNVYMSAAGSTRLRGGYSIDRLLKPPLDTSAGFLDHETNQNGDLVKTNLEIFTKHAKTWGQVYAGLGLVPTAKFNPFREYLGRNM